MHSSAYALEYIAELVHQVATALVIANRDEEATAQYQLSAKLYRDAGNQALADVMTEMASLV